MINYVLAEQLIPIYNPDWGAQKKILMYNYKNILVPIITLI